jgi:transposase-like protein
MLDMKTKNKYCYRSRISEAKFREVVKYFSGDLTAKQIAIFANLNINTVNNILRKTRERIALYCEKESPFKGEIEVDESYFGAKRIRGKRGRGALNKIPVFGILKRNGKVYTRIIPDVSRKTLQGIIKGKVDIDSVIHSDKWRGYNGLVDLGYKKHYRVHHGNSEFVRGKSHINGIENFWGIAKVRLTKFRGIHKSTFYLHLKECEFRFNYRNENLYAKILKILRKNSLN